MSMSLVKTLNNITDEYPDIKLQDIKMLAMISASPDCTEEVYGLMGNMKKHNVNYSIKRLKRHDLIDRVRNASLCKSGVTRVTEKGQELLMELPG